MNANTQRSLNAGWTRHQNTRPAPQVRPVEILTRAGATVVGVAWIAGQQVSYDRLMEVIHKALLAARAGDFGPAQTAVLIQSAPGTLGTQVHLNEMKHVIPVVEVA